VSPVKYELGFYIPEDGILHSDRRGNFNSPSDVTAGRIWRTRYLLWTEERSDICGTLKERAHLESKLGYWRYYRNVLQGSGLCSTFRG
jgi:hypothetical protein